MANALDGTSTVYVADGLPSARAKPTAPQSPTSHCRVDTDRAERRQASQGFQSFIQPTKARSPGQRLSNQNRALCLFASTSGGLDGDERIPTIGTSAQLL